MNNGTGEKLFFLITAAIMMYALVYVYYLPEKIFHHIKRKVVIPRPSTINDVIITNNEYPFFSIWLSFASINSKERAQILRQASTNPTWHSFDPKHLFDQQHIANRGVIYTRQHYIWPAYRKLTS